MRIAVSLKNGDITTYRSGGTFQSAVRIAVSLKERGEAAKKTDHHVSIRRADRCLAEATRAYGTDPNKN